MKLSLRKETIRLLSNDALQKAVGGTTSETAGGCGTGGLCMSAYTCPIHTDVGCPRRITDTSDIC
jgi:hypothetical protein